jgi:hypothetical protein
MRFFIALVLKYRRLMMPSPLPLALGLGTGNVDDRFKALKKHRMARTPEFRVAHSSGITSFT